jgi:hypothetical protein
MIFGQERLSLFRLKIPIINIVKIEKDFLHRKIWSQRRKQVHMRTKYGKHESMTQVYKYKKLSNKAMMKVTMRPDRKIR